MDSSLCARSNWTIPPTHFWRPSWSPIHWTSVGPWRGTPVAVLWLNLRLRSNSTSSGIQRRVTIILRIIVSKNYQHNDKLPRNRHLKYLNSSRIQTTTSDLWQIQNLFFSTTSVDCMVKSLKSFSRIKTSRWIICIFLMMKNYEITTCW